MAEVLGLVTSILALAGAGAKLGMTLYTIADGVGSAGREARLLADEVSFFSHALTALSKSLERTTSQTARLHTIAHELVGSCQTVLVDLSALAEELSPSKKTRRKGKVSSIVGRVKWLLQKPKVAFLRSSISSFKSTLTLLVASMDYTEAIDRQAPSGVREQLKVQVEILAESGKTASQTLLDSHRLLEAAPSPSDSTEEALLIDLDTNDGACFTMVPHVTATSTSGIVEELSDTDSECADATLSVKDNLHAQQLVLAFSHDALHRADTQTQWSWYGDTSQNTTPKMKAYTTSKGSGFDQPTREAPWRTNAGKMSATPSAESPFAYQTGVGEPPGVHQAPGFHKTSQDSGYATSEPSVQRKAVDQSNDAGRIRQMEAMIQKLTTGFDDGDSEDRLGELERKLQTLLDKRQKGPISSALSPDLQKLQELERKMAGLQASSEATKHQSFRAPASTYLGERDAWQANNLQSTVEEMVAQYLETSSAPKKTQEHEKLEMEKLEKLVRKHEDERAARTAAEFARKLVEEQNAAREAQAELERKYRDLLAEMEKNKPHPDSLKAPIRFKDAVGRKFSFPWPLVKTWKGMEKLINQAFLHIDQLGEHVQAGHYDLTGPDGEIILPQVWDTMIKPDWEITMSMWPMQEDTSAPSKAPAMPPPCPPDLALDEFPITLCGNASSKKKIIKKKKKLTEIDPSSFPGIEVIPFPPAQADYGPLAIHEPDAHHNKKGRRKVGDKKDPHTSAFAAWIVGEKKTRKAKRLKAKDERQPLSEDEAAPVITDDLRFEESGQPSKQKSIDDEGWSTDIASSDDDDVMPEGRSSTTPTATGVGVWDDLQPTVEDVADA